ncbi:hypothetical protein Ddye_022291 [Dipteronia dyeriana]|uniref:Uncharacterized protein n=1 Tax=Dipteronia dyeriana TaxID=168575 RepID=A0AAD9U3A6_9ROSI|nr:hypothetical protein Ddye_022291 [Dipteronia dyeriana]
MYDSKISPNYFKCPPTKQFDPKENTITPETRVEIMCSYEKDILRSRESTLFGKMSNVDQIRQPHGVFWQADLEDNVVDMFLVSDEFNSNQTEIFDRTVEEMKTLLVDSYPWFNFRAFDAEVQKRIEGLVKQFQNSVEDISLAFTEVTISNDEHSDVSFDDERTIEAVRGKGDASDKGNGVVNV